MQDPGRSSASCIILVDVAKMWDLEVAEGLHPHVHTTTVQQNPLRPSASLRGLETYLLLLVLGVTLLNTAPAITARN